MGLSLVNNANTAVKMIIRRKDCNLYKCPSDGLKYLDIRKYISL